ncbi:MAG: cysteine desulfurase NifS [Actinobacteria bacterium]|nr:cysteine desulfurase NifS [Actinomycetota bacterium]MBU1944761.1 cysteine desulfurase NifS [Actinomycetota bacterium]MBU2688852.1 cysteine desulfurase NifS [Actinomycetota bacterium]
MKFVYLDHAATTRPADEVVEAMRPYLSERFGNPSALYSLGRRSRSAIEEARSEVASLIGADPDEVYFTSGGSESDNMALWGTLIANDGEGGHLVTTNIEHHAVLETAEFLADHGYEATIVGVDGAARVDPADMEEAIRPDTVVVSLMHANNEVGTIEPVADVSRACRRAGVYLHTDAVQTVGNIPVDVDELGVDLLSISGHKLYGPKGVGAIYVRNGVRISRFIQGGEQERGMRAGTENIAGIVGLGAAARLASSEMSAKVERIARLRDRLVERLTGSIDEILLNGHPTERLPNNAHFRIRRIEGEAICLHLDTVGICASTGSACSSEALEPSHVLMAMGVPTIEAHGSLRFSLGRDTTEEDIEYVAENLPPIVERLRAMSPL